MNKKRLGVIVAAAAAICLAAGLILFFTQFQRPQKASGVAVTPSSQNAAQLKQAPSRSFVSPGCCNDASSN
jgi:cytochrome c-type biogenesis protein CcmE